MKKPRNIALTAQLVPFNRSARPLIVASVQLVDFKQTLELSSVLNAKMACTKMSKVKQTVLIVIQVNVFSLVMGIFVVKAVNEVSSKFRSMIVGSVTNVLKGTLQNSQTVYLASSAAKATKVNPAKKERQHVLYVI